MSHRIPATLLAACLVAGAEGGPPAPAPVPAPVAPAPGGLLALAPEAQAAAVRDLVAATTVHLPGGRLSLEAAIAALAVAGNRVALADGVDRRAEADVAAVDGPWWDAVRAVCTAFALRFDEGIAGIEDVGGDGVRIPVGHGCVVLSREPAGPPPFATGGGIALVAEPEEVRSAEGARLTVRMWLRAEPRLPRGSLAWARADEVHLERGGERIQLQPADGDGQEPGRAPAAVLAAALAGAGDGRDTVQASLRLAPVERWKAHLVLKPGAVQSVEQGGRQLSVVLHIDPAPVEWQGGTLPDRRPMLLLSGPGEALDNLQVSLSSAGAELSMRGSSVRNGPDNLRAVMRFLRSAPEGEVTADLGGRVAVAPVPLQLGVRLATPAAAAADTADPDAPSHVAWAAGTAPLGTWIAALAATGNPVLLEVGIPTATPVTVPAVSGSFWDAVLALCQAADLAPAVARQAGVAGGPLRLGRRAGKPLAAAACGPVLAVASTSPATVAAGGRRERQLHLELALAAEPRLAAERFGAPGVAWASFAADQDGSPRGVVFQPAEAGDGDRERMVRMMGNRRIAIQAAGGREAPAAGPGATVRLAGGERSITIAGMLTLPRSRAVHASAEVAVGTPDEVVVGSRVVEILARNGRADPAGAAPSALPADATGILLRGLSGVESVRLAAALADGTPIDGNADANQMGDRSGALWFAWYRVPADGRVAVEITANTPVPPLALPLSVTVPVP